MPYHVGSKGSYGCSGYPALKDDGTVMGCHKTRAQAAAQIYAINQSEGNIGKAMEKIKEGDFVMGATSEGLIHGMVEHIMLEGGTLGTPGTRYALESMPPENPAMSVRIYKEENNGWEPTAYSIGMMYADAQKIDIREHMMDAEETMDTNDDIQIGKAKKPNYEDMIKPRRGGSTPANPRLYARIQREAKDKFDVYPSAVANGWVVQEYKRRGGTYKADGIDTEKREFSTGTRERMAEAGTAMPDGSFPIANANDLRNAIQSVGRAKNYESAKRHIIRRARALGMTDMLPEDWRNSTKKGGDWAGSVFDLNPFVK
jgi:hypothetical protein